jgi:hypothetical protein
LSKNIQNLGMTCALLLCAAPSWATCYDYPFESFSISDPWGCQASCGRSSPHRGLDFPKGVGTPIRAVADGVVVERNWTGCIGNAVALLHPDGMYSGYIHMREQSPLAVGTRVQRGQVIGYVGNTGSCTTGPHLHLSLGTTQTHYYQGWVYSVTVDPYAFIRDHRCTNCQCNSGQVERAACGDCGERARSCNSDCKWAGWSTCEGPDPAGPPTCDTGGLGPCAEGTVRCRSGNLTCVQAYTPSAEVCDRLDNDCNGAVDDGEELPVGTPVPPYAARYLDAAFPRALRPGELGEAWVAFRNEGLRPWAAGEVYLRPDAVLDGSPSRFMPPSGWPAVDAAARLLQPVAPGEVGTFRFPVATPASAEGAERFTLVAPDGQAMTCPRPTAELGMVTLGPGEADTVASRTTAQGTGCAGTGAVGLLPLLALVRRLRRKR